MHQAVEALFDSEHFPSKANGCFNGSADHGVRGCCYLAHNTVEGGRIGAVQRVDGHLPFVMTITEAEIAEDAWTEATCMHGAQVAELRFTPEGWKHEPLRLIVRRVPVTAAELLQGAPALEGSESDLESRLKDLRLRIEIAQPQLTR